jgi:hypothetical protein
MEPSNILCQGTVDARKHIKDGQPSTSWFYITRNTSVLIILYRLIFVDLTTE